MYAQGEHPLLCSLVLLILAAKAKISEPGSAWSGELECSRLIRWQH